MTTMTAIRAQQARCAALGFSPGSIDGVDGPKTRLAYTLATAAQRAKGLPFAHPSGLTRIHLHWTAGGHKPNATDRGAYHVLIHGDGTVEQVAPHTARRSHTLNANAGAVGVSLCAMSGAVERPFNAGSSPVTEAQVAALACEVARLSRLYDIPVSPYSILTHAELPFLGVPQRQKWDVCWLPGMDKPGTPQAVGDELRRRIAAARG